MKASEECYFCLERLLRQAVDLATQDPALRKVVVREGLELLDREFSTDKTSIAVATPLHRLVRSRTGNGDPYYRVKEAELEVADRVRKDLGDGGEAALGRCLVLAARGNSMDFFKELTEIVEDMTKPVDFAIDHTAILERRLEDARCVLYLADNAGEVTFDLPLLRLLGEGARVTYVVKESPVQDDMTLADLETFGVLERLPRVMSTGTDTPGVDMSMASAEFRSEFEAADLILAKGMGYWETLSELPAQGKVFHLLKAKCRPVAESLGVAVDSYVAFMR